ncbi:hypothetical protein C8R44DRAFT_883697 [Mycena epipterygia]|nr:hypothetical protein C8R44DRAFT_883697 [Mycena epipterygia]
MHQHVHRHKNSYVFPRQASSTSVGICPVCVLAFLFLWSPSLAPTYSAAILPSRGLLPCPRSIISVSYPPRLPPHPHCFFFHPHVILAPVSGVAAPIVSGAAAVIAGRLRSPPSIDSLFRSSARVRLCSVLFIYSSIVLFIHPSYPNSYDPPASSTALPIIASTALFSYLSLRFYPPRRYILFPPYSLSTPLTPVQSLRRALRPLDILHPTARALSYATRIGSEMDLPSSQLDISHPIIQSAYPTSTLSSSGTSNGSSGHREKEMGGTGCGDIALVVRHVEGDSERREKEMGGTGCGDMWE